MTEAERLDGISKLMDWRHQDDTVKSMINIVLAHHQQPSVGHLARFEPDAFDELFEEAEAMVGNEINPII